MMWHIWNNNERNFDNYRLLFFSFPWCPETYTGYNKSPLLISNENNNPKYSTDVDKNKNHNKNWTNIAREEETRKEEMKKKLGLECLSISIIIIIMIIVVGWSVVISQSNIIIAVHRIYFFRIIVYYYYFSLKWNETMKRSERNEMKLC